MRYLFIDTSTHNLTIALTTNSEVLSLMSSSNINEHSKYALPALQEAFNKAGLNVNDVDKVMVVNGPGSFTGVRIGVTIAKVYAWTLNKDIIPVSSLLAYALSYSGYDYYVSVLNARRDNVYAGIYDSNYNCVLEEQHIAISKLNDIIKTLKGNIIVIGDIDIGENMCNPIKIDVLAIVNYYKNAQSNTPHTLNPRYLKRVEAEEKLMGVIE